MPEVCHSNAANYQIGLFGTVQLHSCCFLCVQAGGLEPGLMQRLLDDSNPPSILVDALIIISQLARANKQGFNTYETISKATILPCVCRLLEHPDAGVRARVCNLVGNLCRHSSYFYTALERFGVLPLLIERCCDPDKGARKFACFAIGNAGFHNAVLYEALWPAVGPLVSLLNDEEEKTRANAAGALGNLVRNGSQLCGELIKVCSLCLGCYQCRWCMRT